MSNANGLVQKWRLYFPSLLFRIILNNPMQSTFLKRTIKSGLAKAGVSFTRSKHGVVIYLAGGRKHNIFHSALINPESFSNGEYQDSQHSRLIVDQKGLHINSEQAQDLNQAHPAGTFFISLSGVSLQALPGKGPDIAWHWPDKLKNGVRTLIVSFTLQTGQPAPVWSLIQRSHHRTYNGYLHDRFQG
jgi:hypothetical protein